MNVFLVEGYDRDANDILDCLPPESEVQCVRTINDISDSDIDFLEKTDLLVVNINNFVDIENCYDFEIPDAFSKELISDFNNSVRKTVKLAKRFKCRVVMTSIMPGSHMVKLFEALKDDEDIRESFGLDLDRYDSKNVCFGLRTSISSIFTLYNNEDEKLRMITKPYSELSYSPTDTWSWSYKLRELFSEYHEEIEKRRGEKVSDICKKKKRNC